MAKQSITYDEAKKIALSKNVAERRTLAERQDLPAEILFFLANDTDSTVRENIAHNIHTPWAADEILAKDENIRIRNAVADKIIYKLDKNDDYNKEGSPFFKFWQRAINICESLVEDSVDYIRRKTAKLIVKKGYFPQELVEKLIIHPDKDIALHALENVKKLPPKQLDNILKKGESDFLSALSKREEIPGKILTKIIEKGDEEAIKTLITNENIDFNGETISKLHTQLQQKPHLEEALLHKPNLGVTAIKKIAMMVSESALSELIKRQKLNQHDMEEVMRVMKKRIQSEHMDNLISDVVNKESYKKNTSYKEDEAAYNDFINGQLHEERLYDALQQHDKKYILTAISLRANLPQDVVNKAIAFKNGKAIVSIIWRASFSMRFAVAVQQKLAGMTKNIIYPREGEHFPFSNKEMEWQIEFFVNLCKA